MTVSSPEDVAKLTTAALCDNANISAIWRGIIQLQDTIVVGNGTSLTITGASVESAVINGAKKIQLFDVWGALTIVNMTLLDGYAEDSGGAVLNRNSTTLSVIDSIFSGHQARYGAAVYAGKDATVSIEDTQFRFNTAATDGGSVFTSPNTSLTIYNSTFYANSVNESGGAIRTMGTTVITDCQFSDQTAGYGGAVSIAVSPSANISCCAFSNNNATVAAGAIFVEASAQVAFTSCTFLNNTATDYAGSIYADTNSKVNITTSNFTGDYAAVGGALLISVNSIVRLKEVHMSSSSAVSGGAINLQGYLFCYSSSFSNNTAQSRGGAIAGEASSYIGIFNSSIRNNACRGELLRFVVHKVFVTCYIFTKLSLTTCGA
jgi:predicted outer membrane repeat protein